jgi:Carboxypeptidase regulatory-like domain/TonB dependent receptor
MRSAAQIAALLCLLCGFCAAKIAHADSSECAGVVVDENGVPIAAAKITLQSSTGQNYSAETDGAGRFLLRNLSADDYKVEARKEGFFVLTGQTVTLRPGPNDIHLTLKHAEELHEQVQVTASANQIDTQDTTQRETLTAREIRDIPVPNSHILKESLTALPEVVRDNVGGLHIAGARSGETQYLLDGFEIGDPINNTLSARFNIDATRAAEVQTSRIGASYAHSGASVLSLETPDGDDKWRFGTTNPVPGINIQNGVRLGNWYPRFTFSGPIQRGRFWFSDAISLQHTFSLIRELPADANTSSEWAGDNLLRLQYNFSAKHILHGSLLYNRAKDDNLGLDPLNPESTTMDFLQRRSFVSLKDQIWLYDTLIELGVAVDSQVKDFFPQGTAPYVLLVNGTRGNFFMRLHEHGTRVQGLFNITAASRHWHGTHQVSIGANIAGLEFRQATRRGEIQALRADGTLVRDSTFVGPARPQTSNTQAGAYAQDNWSPTSRLVLQAGVRTDWDRFTQSAMFEPRLSANVLPFGDDSAKLSLGWGIYNAPLNLAVIEQSLDQKQIDIFFDATGTVPIGGPTISQFLLPAHGLRQPRFTTSSAGWQQKIRRNTLLDVELLVRNGYHGFVYVDQNPAQIGGSFLLRDTRKDRYRAATVTLRHVFSEDTQLYGAYTRSRAHTNQVLNPALGSIFYVAQQSAPLAWDAANRFLTWGWTPTHIWKIQFSYFFEYRTGYPYSMVNLKQQLVGPPNSSRFPDYKNLNLALEKKFGFRGYLWAGRIEMVNAFSWQNPNVVVNNVDAPNFGQLSGGQHRAFTARVRFAGRK